MAKKAEKPIDYSKPLKNDKYEAFCQESMRDNNDTQAAIRAGYSEKTAGHKASALVVNSCIVGRLNHLRAELAKACGVDAEMLMAEWKKIGLANAKDYYLPSGKVKALNLLTYAQAAAISSITFTKSGNMKLTFHSKESALENMGKHIGFYKEDNEQKGDYFADFLKEISSNGIGLQINTKPNA